LSAFDKNKDGAISKEEYMSTGGTDKTFAMYDSNGDGKLDKNEFGKAKGSESGTPGKGGDAGAGSPMPTR
ncbi:MAG: EF-hand domain-containing protein, partial [Thiobacillus sp.]|nr:EF-hand domain-containing protein [Thiobacillus sp.]